VDRRYPGYADRKHFSGAAQINRLAGTIAGFWDLITREMQVWLLSSVHLVKDNKSLYIGDLGDTGTMDSEASSLFRSFFF
jgi:hypothetical protein